MPLSTKLSTHAQTAMILPHLKSTLLISIGQLCNDNCNVLLNKSCLIAIQNNKIILEGIRNSYDNLWDIPVKKNISPQNYQIPAIHPAIYPPWKTSKPRSTINHAIKAHTRINIFREGLKKFQELTDHNLLDNILKDQTINTSTTEYCKASINVKNLSLAVIIKKKQTHQELIQYEHATCFSPVKSTFEKAIKNNFFSTWPGLTQELVKKTFGNTCCNNRGIYIKKDRTCRAQRFHRKIMKQWKICENISKN